MRALHDRVLDRALAAAAERLQRQESFWHSHDTWDDAWRVTTAHFEVRTTRSWHAGKQLADALEQMLPLVRKLLRTDWVPTTPVPVFVLPDLAQYRQFGQQHGAEHSSILGSFCSDTHPDRPLASYWIDNQTLLRMWLTHALVHRYVTDTCGGQQPTWLVEGLASWFTLFWDYDWSIDQLRLVVDKQRWVPVRELLAADLREYGDADAAHVRFTELGMLFCYLLQFRPDTKDGDDGSPGPFTEYLRQAVRGEDTTRNPVHHLLHEGVERLDADLRAFTFPRRG